MRLVLHHIASALARLATAIGRKLSPKYRAREPLEYTFEVVKVFPHDPEAFTQGLSYGNGFLYEGTGLNGKSSLRKVILETGEVVQQVSLPKELFGEGITLLENEIVQLTWRSQSGFVYDLKDFRLTRQFSYLREGWGVASNGVEIFMSDGTAEIRVLDMASLAERRRFHVRDGWTPVKGLNDLEFVEGEIFANVWKTDRIARISSRSGRVIGWIDLKGLLSPTRRVKPGATLNGIAYDAGQKRLFVTGKLWPSLFEIRLLQKETSTAAKKEARSLG